ESAALCVLDGASGGVELLAEGGELGDRAADHETGGAVAVRGGREGDRALLLRGLLDGAATEPGHQSAQLAVETLDVDRFELPGGDPLVDLPALVRGQTQDAVDQPFEPVHGQSAAGHAREAGGQIGDGDVRISQAVLSVRELRAQSDGGGEGVA